MILYERESCCLFVYSSAQYASDAHFEEMLTKGQLIREEAKKRGKKIVTITCLAADFPRPNATWRKRLADSLSAADIETFSAIVTQSSLVRGLLKTIHWIAPSTPFIHEKVFSNCNDALIWAEEQRQEQLIALRTFYEELLRRHPDANL